MALEGGGAGASWVYLLRHGDDRRDGVKRYIGSTDLPLNAIGRQQARRWGTRLSAVSFDRIFASDLDRTVETARIVAEGKEKGRTIEVLPGLRELDLGAWEGLSFDEVRLRYPDEYRDRGADPVAFRPAGGESFEDLRTRVLPVMALLEKEVPLGGVALVVAHAGVNRVILCELLGMPLANLFRLGQDYGCANLLRRDASGWRVSSMNQQAD